MKDFIFVCLCLPWARLLLWVYDRHLKTTDLVEPGGRQALEEMRNRMNKLPSQAPEYLQTWVMLWCSDLLESELKVNVETPIRLYPDGSMWCALIGKDIQEGIAGFGRSPEQAIEALMAQPGAMEAMPHAVYETTCDQCGHKQVSVAPYPMEVSALECSHCGYMQPIEQDCA